MTDPDDRGTPVDPASAAEEIHDDELLDELTGYLDRGEEPPSALLNRSASNQIAFGAMLRVRAMAREFLDSDAASATSLDEGWVAGILGNVRREAHAGRDIPLTHPSPRASLVMTEGSVRGLIRAAGDQVSGALIGACRLIGDVSSPGATVEIEVEVSVFWGESLPEIAGRLRMAISSALLQHTELTVSTIDVIFSDVHLRRRSPDPIGIPTAADEGIEL